MLDLHWLATRRCRKMLGLQSGRCQWLSVEAYAPGCQRLKAEANNAGGFWKLQTDTGLGTGPLISETEGGGLGVRLIHKAFRQKLKAGACSNLNKPVCTKPPTMS